MSEFSEVFGKPAEVVKDAPGRVNLIGEHTDYNGGFVLPSAIPQRTRIELSPRSDDQVRLFSATVGSEAARFEYRLGAEERQSHWADYLQGVSWVLAKEGFRLRGFEARISSEVPMGSGLSSSAALEVSVMRALREAFRLELDDVRLALLGQKVENEFVGARVGIMDQMAASLADEGTALFIDTRDLSYRRVSLPPGTELAVINSGVSHSNAGGDYNTRRSECEKACELLGVSQLRDLGPDDLGRLKSLPETLQRRARHVITENDRVLRSVEAMEKGDSVELGRLFDASHASMRDDYAVSIPEIDLLVEIARRQPGVYGARLTGGGFGGSIVALVRKGSAAQVGARSVREYSERSGRTGTLLVPS